MTDPLLKTKMALIEKLQLTDEELAKLIEFEDKELRIDLLVGIFKGIYMSAPPAPGAVIHFFTVPSKVALFEGKSAKQFLLDDPSTKNLDRVYRYFMGHAV